MGPKRRDRILPFVAAAALLVLLGALATLQHRWIGQVSRMERERMQRNLFRASSRFAEDFDQEVTRAFLYFHPQAPGKPFEDRERTVHQYERWKAKAPYPGLIREVFLARQGEDGETRLECLRPERRLFEGCAWPADLQEIHRFLSSGPPRRPMSPNPVLPFAAEVPALVIPLDMFVRRDADRTGAFVLLQLDSRTITAEILPALSQRYFGAPDETDYDQAVVSARDPGRVIYRSDPQLSAADLRSADARVGMFGLRPFDEIESLVPGSPPRSRREPQPEEPRDQGWLHDLHDLHGGRRAQALRRGPREERGVWQLVLKRRHGSLDEVVARFRHHNLAISMGIVLLLGATVGMLIVSTQRAQRLARQQIEFVAGISHELHTPLTAMRSAGQNLADGVVADPAQVKRYGALIENEGRRLSSLVGQALDFAGIQSNHKTYLLRPARVEDLIAGAIADSRWLLEERQAQVETDIAPGLPAVSADTGALRRALQNLIENAAKHGGWEPQIEVRARKGEQDRVEISVADHGPGIRREDLPHLFEPFYRGKEAMEGIPGSGLGLSIVRHIAEAHRGRVTAASGGPGQGSTFTISLPMAPGAEAAEPHGLAETSEDPA